MLLSIRLNCCVCRCKLFVLLLILLMLIPYSAGFVATAHDSLGSSALGGLSQTTYSDESNINYSNIVAQLSANKFSPTHSNTVV